VELPPPRDEVLTRSSPVWKVEIKTGIQQAARHDAAAFEDQFRLSTKYGSSNRQHRVGRGQSDIAGTPRASETAHELAVRRWVGGSDVDNSGKVFAGDEELDGSDEIDIVNPGDILAAGAG
jgi:hypothetical protein